MFKHFSIGLYEKALPEELSWPERFAAARNIGYEFLELSIDETDRRVKRLDWDNRTCLDFVEMQYESAMSVPTMCLSGLRRCPLGSVDRSLREEGLDMLIRAVELASRVGIRVVQVAGYDELMDKASTETSRTNFAENLKKGLVHASSLGVTLAIENMDVPFMDSLERSMEYVTRFQSPYLQVYADVGNLSAANKNLEREFALARGHIAAIHIKDTLEGVFRYVPFGQGRVDFHEVFSLIKLSGYTGLLLLEMWNDPELDSIEEAARSYNYITSCMRSSGLT